MSEYLFIGGPADGRRVELPHAMDVVVVPVIPPLAPSVERPFSIDEPACERAEYWRTPFRVDRIEFVVYTHSRFDSPATVVRMLIDRYK